ncbi:MAG: hypothetical protein Q7U04_03610 [Bacteriovorax sp.]|nr:hypothetical protein [Bacteriovorax sp.]
MSNISDVQSQKYLEAETKKYTNDLKQLRTENDRGYQTEAKSKEAELKRMHDDYEMKIANLKNEQEQKLVEIRDRQSKSVGDENMRLQTEVENLKKAHQDQVAEIKTSQQNEIQGMVESHKKTMDNAKQKFVREKSKLEA